MAARAAVTTIVGRKVGPVGYGMLGLTNPWALVEYPAAVKALKAALDAGANFWNGSLHYGTADANSLHLLKHYFDQYPEDASKVVLSIKGAYSPQSGPDGSPEGIRASVEEALKILPPSTKSIDIFQCARVDPNVPIETSIQTLAELVKEGKIKGIGLSEASAATIRRAHAVHPIAAVEVEISLFTPDPLHNGIVDACHELGIAIAAYSPVGRGFLTGQLRSLADLGEKDFRRMLPRFQSEHFDTNLRLVEAVGEIARRKGATVAQVAIGWVVYHGAIPIPGSTNVERIVENCTPAELTPEEVAEIQVILNTLPVSGGRYPAQHSGLLNG
ncbi:NADP-dependent oxidoreductase domain-containing protein [Mycena filopes]|nr:NADP-dependent oxidoreductase domain-containing protein [Mycena filopes]